MPPPVSSISQICSDVATFLAGQLDATALSMVVLVGNPADAAKTDPSKHRVNLFFFRFDPSPIQASISPGDPWQLRLHCLITPFAVKEELLGAGEIDLRLVGEILRVFHEHPVLPEVTVGGQAVRLHAIYHPIELTDLNYLWSTQGGGVPYRPSLVYEFAVTPVLPKTPRVPSPLVGGATLQVVPALQQPKAISGLVYDAPVVARSVAAGEDWEPLICFVLENTCAQTLAFAVGSTELDSFTPQVWIAGEPNAGVTLHWEIWDPVLGWRRAVDAPISAKAVSRGIDPSEVDEAKTVEVPLPFKEHAGQALLHAERAYARSADGAKLILRSNLLLVTLYPGS